tara:strand:- start:1352 stop:1849 length:498 start_codon:yes stop_codon:yes gene_type:complete
MPKKSGAIIMKITLNEAEQRLATFIARKRYEDNRSKGRPDGKTGAQTNKQVDLEGISGEMVVCKMFNVYPDTETNYQDLPKYDLKTPKGSRVDVKTTRYPSGRMLASMKKKVEDCDIYVLVVGEFPTYEAAGWCNAKELLKTENIIDLGHGDLYALDQNKLRAFK